MHLVNLPTEGSKSKNSSLQNFILQLSFRNKTRIFSFSWITTFSDTSLIKDRDQVL